jgi:heme ABC exporter ATP-binding subunit CcmA
MALAVHLRDAVSLAGRFPLLAGVTFDVAEREIVHLAGPNGAGKSSVLRAIAGLVPIASGEAVVLGHDLRVDRRDVRREVSFVGHSTFLYDELSAEENLRFSLRSARCSLDGLQPALERLGLTGRVARTAAGKLSAGQRRRVALAALVARRARLWLLDEPHAGLDAEGRTLLDEIVGEARDAGTTVVFASHELERAAAIATERVEIAGGQVRHDARVVGVPSPPGLLLRGANQVGSDVA